MATVVGLRRGKKRIAADEFVEIEVVDGQQRITTRALLLKAIHKALDSSDKAAKKIVEEIGSLLVKNDELSLLLLQTNHDLSHIFVDYLRDGAAPVQKPLTSADANLADAITDCETFVVEWDAKSAGGSLIELYATVKNRLTVIFHEIDDEALVYTVFEVLNSRGLDVTWFDKLKSLLMAIVFESGGLESRKDAVTELHKLWTDIYRTIGLRQLNRETVRFAGTLCSAEKQNRPMSEEAAVDILTTGCHGKAREVVDCTKWVLKVTQAEDRLLEDNRVRAATYVVQARLVGVAILLRRFPTPEERSILRKWENVTFRIFGLGRKDARTKVGDYIRLAWRITNENLSANKILERPDKIGQDHPIDKVLDELKGDCYSDWSEQLRYFFFRYEEQLAKDSGQKLNDSQWNKIWQEEPSKSIEHNQPRSKGSEDPATEGIFVHRLGNLAMLPPGVNSKLKDRDPESKADTYNHCGLALTMAVGKQIKKRRKWDLHAIEARERDLIQWAKSEWAD